MYFEISSSFSTSCAAICLNLARRAPLHMARRWGAQFSSAHGGGDRPRYVEMEKHVKSLEYAATEPGGIAVDHPSRTFTTKDLIKIFIGKQYSPSKFSEIPRKFRRFPENTVLFVSLSSRFFNSLSFRKSPTKFSEIWTKKSSF